MPWSCASNTRPLVATPAVRNLIRESKTYQIPSAMQVGARSGMVTMDAALMDLVTKGLVALDDVKSRLPETAEQQRAAQELQRAAVQGAGR